MKPTSIHFSIRKDAFAQRIMRCAETCAIVGWAARMQKHVLRTQESAGA